LKKNLILLKLSKDQCMINKFQSKSKKPRAKKEELIRVIQTRIHKKGIYL